MKRVQGFIVVIVAVALFATSCSLRPQVSREELEPIVQRDGVPFDAGAIPDEILDRLASHRVVLVGEDHFLREHREFVCELMRELHARGFRQFLFEWAQAADWLLADFVNDGGLEPNWAPPPSIGGAMITAIRDLNRTLPEDERIQVHGIDVMLQITAVEHRLRGRWAGWQGTFQIQALSRRSCRVSMTPPSARKPSSRPCRPS